VKILPRWSQPSLVRCSCVVVLVERRVCMANNINEKKLFSKCILLSVEKLETNGRTQHSQKTAAMIFPGYFLRSVPCQRRFPVDAVCCVDRRQSSAQRARGSKRCAEPVSGPPVHGRKLCSAVAPTSAEQEAAILQLDACSTDKAECHASDTRTSTGEKDGHTRCRHLQSSFQVSYCFALFGLRWC